MLAESSPYLPGVFGLLGTLVGAAIAGGFSLKIARDARETAEGQWVRDSRREIYDRYLVAAQTLHLACEEAMRPEELGRDETVREDFASMLESYSVIQIVGQRPVIDTARVYTYRLIELRDVLEGIGMVGSERFGDVSQLVRSARHDAIDAMRDDLALRGSARPAEDLNPFATTCLATEWASRPRRRDDPDGLSKRTWLGSRR